MTENKTTTTREWAPNAKQIDFMEVLKNYPNGTTLKDIELDTEKVFATGTINVLITKGYVKTTDTERVSDIVYRNVKIGEKKDKVKLYVLA